MEIRPYASKRQVIDFSDVLAELPSETIVCMNLGVLRIIRKLIVERGLWRTTYAKNYQTIGYEIPTEIEFKPVSEAIAAFLDQTGGNMAFCEDLLTTLQSIVSQGGTGAGGASCGCGSAIPSGVPGVGGGTTDQFDVEGDGGPLIPPSTWGGTANEYQAYKCQAAEYLFEVIHAFWQAFALVETTVAAGAAGATFGAIFIALLSAWIDAFALSAGFISATALSTIGAGALLAAAPAWVPAAIVAIIAAVVVITGLGLFAVFSTFASDWLAKRDQIICDLYNAQTVDDAKAVLVDGLADVALNFAITGGLSAFDAIIRTAVETIIGLVITSGFTNQLFASSSYVNNFAGTYDCTSCGCGHIAAFGTWQGGDTFTSELAGDHRIAIMVNSNSYSFTPSEHCGPELTCPITNIIPGGSLHPTEAFRVFDSAGAQIYISGTTPWPSNMCGRAFYVKKTVSFQADMPFVEGGC